MRASSFRRIAPVAVLAALLSAIGAGNPSFLSFDNLGVLADESSVILLLATGQTLVILLGGIDLSTASLAGLASVLMALTLPSLGGAGVIGVLALTTVVGASRERSTCRRRCRLSW